VFLCSYFSFNLVLTQFGGYVFIDFSINGLCLTHLGGCVGCGFINYRLTPCSLTLVGEGAFL